MITKNTEIIINRNRITHGESKQVAVMGVRIQQAQRDFDADKVESLQNAIDEIVSKLVESVPAGWLTAGVKIGDHGWLDTLTQEQYESIMEAAQPAQPGKKTD